MISRFPFEALALAVAGGLVLTWCFVSLWFPFGWDQGILASIGDVIVRGGMPYKDGWDMKGPLSYYAFALAQFLFGRHMFAIRLLEVPLFLSACTALAWMVARTSSLRTGVWTAVAFALSFESLSWFFVSQPDGWVALFMALGVAPLVGSSDRLRFRILGICGLLVGFCVLVKPLYGAFALVPVVFALLARQRLSKRLMAVVVVGVCASVPPLFAVGWFAYREALDSLIEVHLSYAAGTYSRVSSLEPISIARGIMGYFWTGGNQNPGGKVAVILPVIAFGAFALWRESRQVAATITLWLGIAIFCVGLQGRYWTYHWIPAFPPLAVLGGFGLWKLSHSASGRNASGRTFAFIAAALFLGQVMVSPAIDVLRWGLYASGSRSHREYYGRFRYSDYVAADDIEAASYIRDRTSESDSVVVWGNDATVTFLSGRHSSTRFVFAMPLTQGASGSFRSDYRREYMTALSVEPPLYFVVGLPYASRDKTAVLEEFPELNRLVVDHYRLERQIGFLDLYRRLP